MPRRSGAARSFHENLVAESFEPGEIRSSRPAPARKEALRALLAGALALLLAGPPAVSDEAGPEHEFLRRGATQEALVSVDSVNLSNGAVIVNLPIGSPVHVGGGLSFGLNLYYNSKAWETESSRYSDPILGPLPISFPSRKSRAGLGWTLTLGELVAPFTAPLNTNGRYWLYVDPSGGSHYFYGVPDGPGDPTLFYTRDSSYLRMRLMDNGDRYVEFPDGEVHVFDSGNTLRKIFNPFGGPGPGQNHLAVTYGAEAGRDVTMVQDWHGRTWEVHTTPWEVPWPGPDPPDAVERTIYQVHKVVVPGFDGASATYNFDYDLVGVVPGCAWGVWQSEDRRSMPLLREIQLPQADGHQLSWVFDYHEDSDQSYAKCKQGLLKRATLPSGGKLIWDYRTLDIDAHCESGAFTFYWSKSAAVSRRGYYDVGVNDPVDGDGIEGEPSAEWYYSYWESDPPTGTLNHNWNRCEAAQEQASETLTVVEVTPLKDRIFHAFMIWPLLDDPSEHGATEQDHFLPFIRPGTDPAAGGLYFTPDFLGNVAPDDPDRFVSKAVFDCDENSFNCVPFSVDYVRYETELPYSWADGYRGDRNSRVVSDRTVYFERQGAPEQPLAWYDRTTDRSDFDDLGHYRRTENRSTFPGELPSGSSRVVTRDYNAGDGFAGFGVGAGGASRFPTTDEPWVLEIYSTTDIEEGGQASRVESLFDPDTGFLQRERVWADTGSLASLNRRSNDLVKLFEPDAEGNVAAISTFGGDRQNDLPDAELADLSLTDWEYRTENDYAFGYLAKEESLGRHGSSLLVRDVTIDKHTGLPTASRDATGLETLLDYDELGRLKSLTPPGDAATTATRTPPTASQGPVITLQRSAAGQVLQERITQDGFERNVLEEMTFPDGQWSSTAHTYGRHGLLSSTTTPFWSADGPASAGSTSFHDYDPMARPLRTVTPDGSVTTLAVDREHAFTTTSSVATGETEELVSRTLFKDSRGRVVAASEHSEGASPVTTSYEYDVGQRLVRVAIPYSGGGFQERLFTYDNRGFRSSETHPESGTLVQGSFDTRGNPGTQSHAVEQLRFVYDDLGRSIQVWDDARSRLMAETFYSRTNRGSGSDRSLGKIVAAKRHNYLVGGWGHVVITETYAYEGPGGRLSKLRTRSNTGFDVGQAFSYDALGNLSGQSYPLEDVLPGAAGPDRELDYQFDQGKLAGLTTALGSGLSRDVVDDVTYHPQGAVASLFHANGVEDRIAIDPSGLARPASIRTVGVAGGENWLSGTYSYDGSGNVRSIGTTQSFQYDAVMRLTEAEVAGVSQTYDHDRFGNLLTLGSTSFTVDQTTNRLTGGFTYDAAGNLLSGGGRTLTYDALGMVDSRDEGGGSVRYVYGVGNERIAWIKADGQEYWTVRDLSHRLLREYRRAPGGPWVADRDYLYGGRLVASIGLEGGTQPALERHYHPDHLGSPRLLTDGDGIKVSEHTYLPFGHEIGAVPDGERLKFTGHERDAADLDYMHARSYGNLLGRFTSVDPVLGSPESPQSWNRYVYSSHDPLNRVDPDGAQDQPVWLLAIENKSSTAGHSSVDYPRHQRNFDQQVSGGAIPVEMRSHQPGSEDLHGQKVRIKSVTVGNVTNLLPPGNPNDSWYRDIQRGNVADARSLDNLGSQVTSRQVTVRADVVGLDGKVQSQTRVYDAVIRLGGSMGKAFKVVDAASMLINYRKHLAWRDAFTEGHGRPPTAIEGSLQLLGAYVPTSPCENNPDCA